MDNKTFDLQSIIDESPLEALKHLCEQRKLALFETYTRACEIAAKRHLRISLEYFVERMPPVNPLLLSTAISISTIRRNDFKSFLQYYIKGLEIPYFDETLIKLVDFQDDKELSDILHLEAEFVTAFITQGTEMLIEAGKLIPDTTIPTMLDIYWGTWLIANPMYEGQNIEIGWRRAIKYGFDLNDSIHNAREYYEFSLNEINKEINYLSAQTLPPAQKRNALVEFASKQSNVTKLVERARRLYSWAPHEISADAVATEIASDDTSPYLLPLDIQEKINKRKERKYE